MKKLVCFLTILAVSLFISCGKKNYEPATVVRNCTGTYLRINSKHYFVCNPQKIASYGDQSQIKAAYAICSQCSDGYFHCEMLWPFDGYLIIDKVN